MFAKWLEEHGVTHTSLVPTQVHDLVTKGVNAPTTVSAVVVGGGRLPEKLGQAARGLGWPVLASYGMTETASQVATQGLEDLAKGFVPTPLPLLDIWEVSVSEEGCFRFSGPALFSGKLVRRGDQWVYKERTGEWFTTKDLGTIPANGRIRMEGRADELVKVLGELVSPSAVEAMLADESERTGWNGFCVLAVPDTRMGHRLVPVLEDSADQPAVLGAIKRHNASCAGYLRMTTPVLISRIPRSALGKVQRQKLMGIIGNKL